MTDIEITVTIGGDQFAPKDLVWVEYAPCGCKCGWVSVMRPHTSEPVLDTDSARRVIFDSAAERKRAEEDGFRLVLESRLTAYEDRGGCTHAPKYGLSASVVPEGYVWANGKPGSPAKHLVERVTDTGSHWVVAPAGTEALCGASSASQWRDETGKVTCRKCEKAAAERVGVPA